MILVTGGTGLLGAHLLYKLTSKEEKVVAIYRNDGSLKIVQKIFSYYTDNPSFLFNRILWVKADITDVPALDVAFKNVTHVYHCAADLSFDPKNYYQSRLVNVEGTANVVNLCLSNGVSKLCHVSSIATLGEAINKSITEDTHWNPENNRQNIYAITKYDAELEVWRGAQEGLSVVIVNPGVILGPGFWNSGTGKMFSKVSNGFAYYTSGSVGVVDVNDVVKSMLLLLDSDIVNEKFIVVSENLTYEELINSINSSLEINNVLKEVKRWQLMLYMRLEKLISTFFGKQRSIYKANINSAFKNLVYDNTKIEKAIGMSFVPVTESVKDISELIKKEH